MAHARGTALVLAGLLFVAAAPGFAGGAIPDNRVTITDATVSPTTPTAGAPTTIDATVRLSAGSSSAATLERVEVVDENGDRLGTATDLGSLSPGETLSVPVTVTFQERGTREVTVRATVSDDDGERTTVSRPLSIAVESGAPQIETDVDGLVEGVDSAAAVTLSNPTTASLRDITVAFVDVDGEQTRQTVPTLAAGAVQTLNFSLDPQSDGVRDLTAEVTYTTAAGSRATETVTRSVSVEPLREDVGVRVGRATIDQQPAGGDVGGVGGIAGALGGGSTLQSSDGDDAGQRGGPASVTVTNFGNAAIEDVVLVPRLSNGSVATDVGRTAVADSIAPGSSAGVTVDLSAVDSSALRFTATYEIDGERGETTQRYDLERPTGAVSVTGLSLSIEDERLQLSGNLGNVGDGEVSGVVIGVGEGSYAAPAYPGRDQFLGTVGSSEFAPFELTARVDTANVTSVPIEIRYTTAGERRTTTVEVAAPVSDDGSDGGVLAGNAVAAVAVGVWLLVTAPLVAFSSGRYR